MYFLEVPELSISPDILFQLGPVNITNTMLAFFVSSLILVIMALYVRSTAGIIPTKLQVIIEDIVTFFSDKVEAAFGSEEDVKTFMPFMVTMFLLFFVANQFSILPFITQLTYNNGAEVALFKAPTSDFSLPIALALVVAIISHVMALRIAPLKHIGSFFQFEAIFKIRKFGDIPFAFLDVFLGLLDIIGEFAKVVSISARLFGNVIAGELMVVIITWIAGTFSNFVVPIPFIFLSIFSGSIQAFVFPLLATQYIGGTVKGLRDAKREDEEKKKLKMAEAK